MRILIQNGRVIDPKNKIDEIMDLLIEDGVIKEVAPSIEGKADQVIDATGKIVAPGLVDLHVHFREPGLEYKEDIETGSKAAAKGGVTTVVCMPNTSPVIDNKAQVRYVMERGKEVGLINVLTSGCITKGQSGTELSEMGEMREAGAVAVVKGLRAVSDFEDEFQQSLTNKKLNPDLETVFLTAEADNMFLSSSVVKQVCSLGGDISDFVPAEICDDIVNKLRKV